MPIPQKTMLEALYTEHTCGDACWHAHEDICRCSCGGRNHGCLRKEKRIVLIDDAESVFPRRDWVKGESWHIAQNNVMFHELDRIDTSLTMVILTTNELSLMDKALRDRLYEIEFKSPPKETLLEIAKDRCEDLMIPWQPIVERIEANDKIKTIRDVEKVVLEYCAEGGW